MVYIGQTSPIQSKISKLECSCIGAAASSLNLSKALAQAAEHKGSEMPVARNNLKITYRYSWTRYNKTTQKQGKKGDIWLIVGKRISFHLHK